MATEQPEPIQPIFTGYWIICVKNASSATVLSHCMLDNVRVIQEKVTFLVSSTYDQCAASCEGTASDSLNHMHSTHRFCMQDIVLY